MNDMMFDAIATKHSWKITVVKQITKNFKNKKARPNFVEIPSLADVISSYAVFYTSLVK